MMTDRRTFLGTVGGFAAALCAAGCRRPARGGNAPRVAAQLYSIHKIFWKRPEECLEGLCAVGYDGVEFAGYEKHSAADIASMLKGAGMRGMGTHVNGDVDLVGDALKRTLDFCKEAGIETVTTPHAKRNTADEYVRFGHDMGVAAEAAAAYGIKVGVHTTYHHFQTKYGDETAWDMIYKDTSPLLQQQIDTSNVIHTGTDIVGLLRKYPGRHYSVHLKENTPSKTATLGEPPTDGGKVVPWREVFAQLEKEPVAWYVVEAEQIPDSLRPLSDSLAFIRERTWAN